MASISISARAYTVTYLTVIPSQGEYSDVVTHVHFTYGNEVASLIGICPLPAAGVPFIPLDEVTKEQAMQWLLAYCPNTTAEFDANLDSQIAYAENTPYDYEWPAPQPSGVINTGRGTGLGPEDLNPSYFVSLENMPGYTQADLELYVPGTDTVIPYNASLPDPYRFDSMGDCFNTGDYRLVIRYANDGAVLSTITVPESSNVDVAWTYNPNIPSLGGGGGSNSSQR